MKKEENISFKQIFPLIVLLFILLIFIDPFSLFMIALILLVILEYSFKIKNFNYLMYNILLVSIFALQGLTLFYTFLFRSTYLKELISILVFSFFILIFTALIAVYARHYRHRKEYTQIP